ncbi:MAG: 3-oxoacyl-[acyl-carrier protein] reductase [Thermotogaceae bacterium]|nr:3-oxoacyl-[acyl-carrier protein] reductase [Thermotogaceae bacterium]MDN5337311.1 3-oxoacyl-[acyl-carrier protein] reductase [Thermotogaceae bacterium]
MKLRDKIAVVTGATGDIGSKICEVFISEGATVIGLEKNDEKFDELSNKFGESIEFFKVDITDSAKLKEVVNEISKKYSKIDILVNNAGITKDNLFLIMSEKEFIDVINVNLIGTFLVTKEVARVMRKQKEGSIINISSVVGIDGNVGQANYSASKAAIIGLTKTLAKELTMKGEKIRVNAIAPGFIESRMTVNIPDNLKNKVLERLCIKRFGRPEDVAKLVLFLASDDSQYITGQVIRIDGGLTL